jgi:hypothetical protein
MPQPPIHAYKDALQSALTETIRVMDDIGTTIDDHGGWPLQ